jgi:hypothetical protein
MRYMLDYGPAIGFGGANISAALIDRAEYASSSDQPATLPAWQYPGASYSTVYAKSALGLWTLESIVGAERFRRAMADYLAEYRFKHPTGADFRASIERSLGGDLSWFFDDYMNGAAVIDYAAGPIEHTAGGDSVSVIRTGGVRAPVEVRVTLASGAQEIRSWDGRSERTSFVFPAGDAVTRVEIDPARKLKAELNVLDNGLSATPQVGAALTLGGRLAFLFQALAQALGLFG